MDRNSIAAQLYTLRDYIQTPEQIASTLRKVKEIGYRAVQVSGMGPIEPMRLKEIVDTLGLRICATHTPLSRLQNDLDAVIREHTLWDCEYVGMGYLPDFGIGVERYSRFLKDISGIVETLRQNGLKFVYHNHNFEFEKFDGKTGMDLLFENSDSEAFGFEIDTYWVQAGGANPVNWIRKVKGRMGIVHFKDMAIVEGKQVFSEIGEGNIDWAPIIRACRETGVQWYAVEQDECRRDPFESLEMSLRYLEKFI
jgi:sugar phosphate isomerase/epimerase